MLSLRASGRASCSASPPRSPTTCRASLAILARAHPIHLPWRFFEYRSLTVDEPRRPCAGTLTPFSAACDKAGQPERAAAAPQSSTLRALVMAPPDGVGVPLSDLGERSAPSFHRPCGMLRCSGGARRRLRKRAPARQA